MKNIILLSLENIYSYLHLRSCIYIHGVPGIIAKSKNFNLDPSLDKNINKNELDSFIFNNVEGSTAYHVIVSHEDELLSSFGLYLTKDLTYESYDIELVNELSIHIMGHISRIYFTFESRDGNRNNKLLTISLFKYGIISLISPQ